MNNKVIGTLELFLASAIYGFYGLFYRYVGDFGSFSQNYVRAIIVILMLLLIVFFSREKLKMYEKEDWKWVAIWILPSSLQPAITFLAFNNLPIGIVYYLLYAAAIITSFILGKIFYKEELTVSKLISLILVLVGITIIYGSDLTFVANIYVLFALLAGALIGSWNIMTKKLSGKYSENQMLITDYSIGGLISLVVALIIAEPLPALTNTQPWIFIFLFAVVAILSGVLLVRGFSKVEAQVGSLIVPLEIVFGSIVGYFFFSEKLGLTIYVGGLLILIASVLPYLFEIYQAKKNIK